MLFKLALLQNLHTSRSAARRDIGRDRVWYLQEPDSHGLPSSSSMKCLASVSLSSRKAGRIANL